MALDDSVFNYEATKSFGSQQEALDWAIEQKKNGGPKYMVQQSKASEQPWEAVQAWLNLR